MTATWLICTAGAAVAAFVVGYVHERSKARPIHVENVDHKPTRRHYFTGAAPLPVFIEHGTKFQLSPDDMPAGFSTDTSVADQTITLFLHYTIGTAEALVRGPNHGRVRVAIGKFSKRALAVEMDVNGLLNPNELLANLWSALCALHHDAGVGPRLNYEVVQLQLSKTEKGLPPWLVEAYADFVRADIKRVLRQS